MITLVVFSKDRAMQLDSLLRSVKDHCTGIGRVVVVANSSSPLHTQAYMQLLDEHGAGRLIDAYAWDAPAPPPPKPRDPFWDKANPTVPGPLGAELSRLLVRGPARPSGHVALAVDDMIFYRPSDFARAAILLSRYDDFVWSWRLGLRSPLKQMHAAETHWTCSPFVDDPDYQYMFHSDGALYRTADYVNMLDKWLPYWKTGKYTPNDLEAAVAAHRTEWAPLVGPHVGPLNATCITWQLNRVQTKYGSPAAETRDTNIDALAQAYLDGKRVRNEVLYDQLQRDSLRFNPPGARPTHVYASEEASRFWASCIR